MAPGAAGVTAREAGGPAVTADAPRRPRSAAPYPPRGRTRVSQGWGS